jgi:hypothetical protein
MTMSNSEWKDLASDLGDAFAAAITKGGEELVNDIAKFSSRARSNNIRRSDELLERLKEWNRALWKRVNALDDADAEEVASMVNDAWEEAALGYADSKDSRYNTDYDESVRGRMKALLGEANANTVDWEAEMRYAVNDLRTARDSLLATKKRMERTAPTRDHFKKFSMGLDKALAGIETALDGFTY